MYYCFSWSFAYMSENSPDTSAHDSTVQTINTVTFITCPAVGVSILTYNVNEYAENRKR